MIAKIFIGIFLLLSIAALVFGFTQGDVLMLGLAGLFFAAAFLVKSIWSVTFFYRY